MILPPCIRPGDTVGIVAPSGPLEPERLAPAVSYLTSRGYRVLEGVSIHARDRYLAGTDAERASDLMRMFETPEVRAVFVARGGYGSGRLLDRLDYGLIADNPKPMVGFSDTTALQMAVQAHTGLVTYTGLTLCGDVTERGLAPAIESSLWDALVSGSVAPVSGLRALNQGRAVEGLFLGGCLSLVASLVGTRHLPDLEGAVLFLEDVNEEPYRLDRMLTQLRQAGVFDAVSGLVLGDFQGCEPERPTDGSAEEVFRALAEDIQCPVYTGLPYGHGSQRRVFPLGVKVNVDSASGELHFHAPEA